MSPPPVTQRSVCIPWAFREWRDQSRALQEKDVLAKERSSDTQGKVTRRATFLEVMKKEEKLKAQGNKET